MLPMLLESHALCMCRRCSHFMSVERHRQTEPSIDEADSDHLDLMQLTVSDILCTALGQVYRTVALSI